jgi:hypothetical protein
MVLSERPPEGLMDWIREQKDIDWRNWLVYRAGYIRDPITGIKEKSADATCTACGKHMQLLRHYGKSSPFGVAWIDEKGDYHSAGNYEKIHCPECGAEVRVTHISSAEREASYAWVMTAERQGETFFLYFWRIRRGTDKTGGVHWGWDPWEAYAFGGGKAGRYSRWGKMISGSVYIKQYWDELKSFRDEIREIDLIYCPEGLENVTRGTDVENSKLEIYMKTPGEWVFPVTWLRIYQKHRKAETLMTCGAAKLTAGMIAAEKREHLKTWYGQQIEHFNTRTDLLHQLDWRKNKPHEILRIQKSELAYFRERETKDGAERLRALEWQVKCGMACKAGEELATAKVEDIKEACKRGLTPKKVENYLIRQRKRYKEGRADKTMLYDYWNMAEKQGIDLSDREQLLPQNLRRAHDLCVTRIKEEETAKRNARFRKRLETLSQYSWEKDGILIRPVASEEELIAEGKCLRHCVATYSERHANGGTSIFLVRRAEDPEAPWFTLEFDVKTGEVIQNRGFQNCERTPEVKTFEKAWLEWVRAGCKRKEKNAA